MKHFIFAVILLLSVGLLGACTGSGDVTTATGVTKATDTPTNTADTPGALPPLVKVRGDVYKDTGYVNSGMKCGTADGTIRTSVDVTKTPSNNDESNFGTGFEYQTWEPGYLNVKRGERWILFQDIAMNSTLMPKGVANFRAEVKESDTDRLMVQVVQVPPEYAWIFTKGQNRPELDVNNLKPIALPVDNLDYTKDGKTVDATGLTGKTVTVWFDGTISGTEPEMSYPAQLGQVYKIKVIEGTRKGA